MAIAKPTLERLASHLIYSSNREIETLKSLMEIEEVEFRKNKGMPEIENAITKAKSHRIGRGRVEIEQNALECYLDDILKAKIPINKRKKLEIL